MRGAIGLGDPEVRAGARGIVRLVAVVPVPARITAVSPGRFREWRVGPVRMGHEVRPGAGGCEIVVTVSAVAPVESVVAAAYGPVITATLSNLARVAAREAAGRG